MALVLAGVVVITVMEAMQYIAVAVAVAAQELRRLTFAGGQGSGGQIKIYAPKQLPPLQDAYRNYRGRWCIQLSVY